jgi:uncharacterized protein (TIGR00369 family)
MPPTGLEILRAIVNGDTPQASISATLHFTITAADDGRVEFRGTPGPDLLNPMGSVHGGWACTLLDSAMGSAVMSTLDSASMYTTTQLTVNLTRTISVETGPVVCEGKIIHRGRKVATAEGQLRDAKGNLLAHGTTTCLILPRG